MNAFNTINLAGACLLTSTEYATKLGINENQWVYPLGGAGSQDSAECKFLPCRLDQDHSINVFLKLVWMRPNFYTSPSIARSLDAGLEVSGLTKDEIDFYDFYSSVQFSFPSCPLR